MNVCMQLNIDKLLFTKEKVDYLSYIMSQKGIKPHPSNVQLIIDMPELKTVTQLIF